MEAMEWRTADKSTWGPGSWHDEPDKAQWTDEATGLPCLIVRNHSGSLCGYVGVPETHPWHGKGYSDEVPLPPDWNERKYDEVRTPIVALVCASKHSEGLIGIDLALDVHGGCTFAGGCHAATAEGFEKMRSRIPAARIEASKYPVGASAKWLRDWVPVLDSFEAFKARVDATAICHLGEPDKVWWFGFDCSHSGDASPAYDRQYGGDGTYRDLGYVKHEIAGLAKQLAAANRA